MKKIFSIVAVLLFLATTLNATEVTATYQRVMNNVSLGNATSTVLGPAYLSRCRETALDLVWATDPNPSGTVLIETAHDPSYTGTWANLTTVTSTGALPPHEDTIQISGVMSALRARIFVDGITGTVSVWAVCN